MNGLRRGRVIAIPIKKFRSQKSDIMRVRIHRGSGLGVTRVRSRRCRSFVTDTDVPPATSLNIPMILTNDLTNSTRLSDRSILSNIHNWIYSEGEHVRCLKKCIKISIDASILYLTCFYITLRDKFENRILESLPVLKSNKCHL